MTIFVVPGLLLNCNWAIVSDITLYIVIPTRRSFASATQILVSHAFGDAISPYLIGAIADFVNGIISQKIPPEVAIANGISPINTTTSDISHLPDNLEIKVYLNYGKKLPGINIKNSLTLISMLILYHSISYLESFS